MLDAQYVKAIEYYSTAFKDASKQVCTGRLERAAASEDGATTRVRTRPQVLRHELAELYSELKKYDQAQANSRSCSTTWRARRTSRWTTCAKRCSLVLPRACTGSGGAAGRGGRAARARARRRP